MKIGYSILTLRETPERLIKSLDSLSAVGIKPKVFYGLNNNKTQLRTKYRNHRLGLIGCWISHLLMWQNSLDSETDWYVFMEDDFEAKPETKTDIETMIQNAPFGYDVVFLLANPSASGGHITKDINQYFAEKTNMWSTACYAIPKESIKKLIELYNIEPQDHIDIDLNKKYRSKLLKVCYPKKNAGSLMGGVVSSIIPSTRIKNRHLLFGQKR